MSGKFALVIGNTEYNDRGLAQLAAPGKDAEDFARVLENQHICAFDEVKVLLNERGHTISEEIEALFDQKRPDDLLLLYFSGHGVRDASGALHLAVTNTNRSHLRSTAIKSNFISELMDQSRSKRQILILDCCYSGAFGHGTKAETGGKVGAVAAFKGTGYGRVILTAGDATQFAWEGDKVIGESHNSLFTHFLIKGLEGEADSDGDGRITVDELYDYVFEEIISLTSDQTPGKWVYKQQGGILLRPSTRIEDMKPLPLPSELIDQIEDPRSYVREAAVQQLIQLANGRNFRLALSARESLEHLANKQAEEERLARAEAERKAKEEAESLVAQKAEEERLTRAEAERKAKEEADRLAAQKAEADRLARQKAKDELAAKAQAEKERKAKEKVNPLAAQKAEAERLARQRVDSASERQGKATPLLAMFKGTDIAGLLTAFTEKIRKSRPAMYGIGAVVLLVIAGISIRAFSNPGVSPTSEPVTETPVIQPTIISSTQPATVLAETPTLETIIPVAGPKLEVGAMYPYVDGGVLVAVPRGEFSMGGGGTDNLEHNVILNDYWIYSTEVTNQQYALCVSSGRCKTPDANDNPGFSDYKLANDPVTGVTYQQAVNYCQFVNGRLPSEAEWEKAARNPQGGNYPWGEAAPSCDFLNFNNCQAGMANVTNYAKGASYYGALNMSGNAFEWVADWYDAKYYVSSPAENPTGPAGGTLRSVRSSSYSSDANQVVVAARNSENSLNHRSDLGFRCAVDDPTHFAPFCEVPPTYANVSTQNGSSLESCPDLAIKPVQFCNNNIPFTNVTFVGPSEATKDIQDCAASGIPNRFTCKKNGEIVSISAACQLNELGDSSCPSGYSIQGNTCLADTGTSQTAGNCLAGDYNASGQCCSLPQGGTESAALHACPVGTFYAAKANACLPQPVQELITVSLEVTLPKVCTTTSGVGDKGPNGPGGCQAAQSIIDNCNAQSPFYSWSSASCSCRPAN